MNLPPTCPISAANLPHPFPLLLSLSTRQFLTSTTRCRFRYTPSHTRGGCYPLNLPPTRPISATNLPHLPQTRPISAANSPHPFPFLLSPFPFRYINFRRTFIFYDTIYSTLTKFGNTASVSALLTRRLTGQCVSLFSR